MKIALITDTHFGARNDSQIFSDYFALFYSEIFFPTLKQHNIDTVIHCGDVFDRRKYINFKSLYDCKKYFFEPLRQNNIKCYMIAGNHDTFYKSTNKVNAVDLLLQEYDNIKVYYEPCEVNIGDTEMLMLPWICSDNYQDSMNAINGTKCSLIFSHLELNGFEVYKGQMCHDGMDPKIFDRFDIVVSGHFHHKSDNGTVYYLGNPYQLFWGDYKDTRGFHIFDTNTREFEYIINDNEMFMKYYYDDSNMQIGDIDLINFDVYKNKYVKVVVENKTNPYIFDMLLDSLYKIGANDISIIETLFDSEEIDDDIIDQAKDTITILNEYIDNMSTNVDKLKLQTLMNGLYNEALEIQ